MAAKSKRASKSKAKRKSSSKTKLKAAKTPLLCGLPVTPLPQLPAHLDPRRASAILLTQNKWVNGTVLHYYFMDRGAALASQMDQVRKGFKHWKDQGIGLEFTEVQSAQEAEIRITFKQGAGSASYVGTDNLHIPQSQGTMNFGWSLTATAWGWATTLHEIGHALGMPHEHQNPKAGIVWDEPKVYDTYSKPPNSWDRAKIQWNIIRKLPESSIAGSNWDPKSIMHYPIAPGLMKGPAPYSTQGTPANTQLSPDDVAYIKAFYPPIPKNPPVLDPLKVMPISDKIGGQVDFTIKPTENRKYTLQTTGEADTRIVLFERLLGRVPSYLAADDDSGEDKNAKIVQRLTKGRIYIARVRTNYIKPGQKAGFSIT